MPKWIEHLISKMSREKLPKEISHLLSRKSRKKLPKYQKLTKQKGSGKVAQVHQTY